MTSASGKDPHGTAERYWSYARTWLYCELGGKDGAPDSDKKSPAG